LSQPGVPGGSRGSGEVPEEPEDAVLRAKYLDYCSARMADILLRLSADEMYLLAEDAARELGGEEADRLSYDQIVRLATERISQKLSLPPFETWKEAYREDPDHFEREMLGLWESDLHGSEASGKAE